MQYRQARNQRPRRFGHRLRRRAPRTGELPRPLGLPDAQDTAQGVEAIHAALEAGITYFNTAASYGAGRSEQIIGQALATAGAAGQRAVVATKVSRRDRDGIVASVEASLRHLQRETLDVLQFHGSGWREDDLAAVLEGDGLETLEELRRQGKVRAIGFTSETPSPGAFRLLRSDRFDVVQIAYNVMYNDACNLMIGSGLMVEARERGLGVVSMRSLSSGVFQKLIAQHLVPALGPDTPPLDLHAFALTYVLSNPYLDSAIVGMRTGGRGAAQRRAGGQRDALRPRRPAPALRLRLRSGVSPGRGMRGSCPAPFRVVAVAVATWPDGESTTCRQSGLTPANTRNDAKPVTFSSERLPYPLTLATFSHLLCRSRHTLSSEL